MSDHALSMILDLERTGAAAQVSFDNVGFRYAFIATVIVVIGIVTLVVARTFFRGSRSGDSMDLDLEFLDKVGDSKKLSPDELKKIREATVRRALARRQEKADGTNMSELMRIVSGLEPPVAEQQEEPLPLKPSKPTPVLRENAAASVGDAVSARSEESAEKPEDPADGNSPVGLEALLEKGIITRKEYEQMSRRSAPPRQG